MAEEKKFTEAEVVELIQRALKKQEDERKKNESPSIVQVAEDKYVQLTFIGVISSGTSVNLGALGKITRPGTTIDVPKKDFVKSLGIPVVEALLHNRKVVVLDGLTEAERERYGVKYAAGELLTVDEYFSIPQMPIDILCKRMDEVCYTHKMTIVNVILNEYFEKKNPNITLANIKKLNQVAKRNGMDDAFYPALSDLANQIMTED